MTRYLGGIISSSFEAASSGGGRSGMWSLSELERLRQTTRWYSSAPNITASTWSTADATAYTFANQPIGDYDSNKMLYIFSVGGATAQTVSVTVNGTAATLLTSVSGAGLCSIMLSGIQLDITTTTATIVTSHSATCGRVGIHVYQAYPNKLEPVSSTVQNSSTSTAYSLTVPEVPAGGFVLAAAMGAAVMTTAPFVTGIASPTATTFGAENSGGTFISGIATATTVVRTSYNITTTHTSLGNGVAVVASAFY